MQRRRGVEWGKGVGLADDSCGVGITEYGRQGKCRTTRHHGRAVGRRCQRATGASVDSTAGDVVHSGIIIMGDGGCYRFKNTIKAVSTDPTPGRRSKSKVEDKTKSGEHVFKLKSRKVHSMGNITKNFMSNERDLTRLSTQHGDAANCANQLSYA
ncbi:hypothetical protein GW17_00036215 [Ensete ventricosum]|nr:hypothetical protein GW17_00036215 [Ensete ventricosum]